ncbi:MAG: four helix bundle protein [Gemmatimonadaceae bacterium]
MWQKAHSLALRVDHIAGNMRPARHASLRSQIVRAAMSIPANIAEGRRQTSERDFGRFLRYSVNSAYELEYHLVVAHDIEAIGDADAKSLMLDLIEVRRMLYGLIKKVVGAATESRESRKTVT